MVNPSRKKRKRKASVVGAVLKLLFLLLLLSMLAAYIANQVALSSKKAELDTLQEQILGIEDVDLADAITSYSWAQYCYNVSIKVGNSILSQSLMDYMNT